MRLANYGMIALNGAVSRPEPSADFTHYQNALASYRIAISLRNRVPEPTDDADDRLKRLAESVRRTLDTNGKQEQ